MSEDPIIEFEEIKTRVAKRVPPGDRWQPLDNTTLVLESLTDILEYVYQQYGNTQFFMDVREGYVYTVNKEEKEIIIKPEKRWTLYGDKD